MPSAPIKILDKGPINELNQMSEQFRGQVNVSKKTDEALAAKNKQEWAKGLRKEIEAKGVIPEEIEELRILVKELQSETLSRARWWDQVGHLADCRDIDSIMFQGSQRTVREITKEAGESWSNANATYRAAKSLLAQLDPPKKMPAKYSSYVDNRHTFGAFKIC